MLWVPGLADLVKGVKQGILALGLESNMEFDRVVIGRWTQAEPVVWDDIPLVFYHHVVLRRRDSDGHRGTTEKHQEHRESKVAHNCKKASRG